MFSQNLSTFIANSVPVSFTLPKPKIMSFSFLSNWMLTICDAINWNRIFLMVPNGGVVRLKRDLNSNGPEFGYLSEDVQKRFQTNSNLIYEVIRCCIISSSCPSIFLTKVCYNGGELTLYIALTSLQLIPAFVHISPWCFTPIYKLFDFGRLLCSRLGSNQRQYINFLKLVITI